MMTQRPVPKSQKAVAACLQFSCRDVVLPLLTGEEEQALPQPLDRAHECAESVEPAGIW